MQKRLDKLYTEYLVTRAQTGDREGLNLLAEHYQKRLMAFAYRLTADGEMAQEAVQEAWADIVRGLVRLSDVRLFNAWAYKIVSRRCADQIRKVQRRRKINSAYASEPRPQATIGEHSEQSTDSNTILALIQNLPDEQRTTMVLFYSEDLGVAEIAHITGVPVGTVKTRLLHARNKIRAKLEGNKHV